MSEKADAVRRLLRIELSRREFWQFCKLYDPVFFSERKFLKQVADVFQEIADGKIKSCSVSMPPRAGKSYITSLFCAWTLGKNPEGSVMRNTVSATLYSKFSYDVRNIVKSDIFAQVFPGISISDDKANLAGWNLNRSKQVGYFGAGVGGTIIGFGATNVAITDDLYRGVEDALSDTVNDRTKQWFEATHLSRMESGCARIDIGTRWTMDDIIGSQMKAGYYDKSIVIQALNEKDESFCEAVMTTAEYHDKRKRTSKEIWLAEYQQEPVDMKGRLFGELAKITPKEWDSIQTHIKDEQRAAIAYIDVSDQGKDYTACAVGVIHSGKVYVVDYIFNRENTDTTIPMAAGMLTKHKVSYCRVESNNMGAMFGRQLQQLIPDTRILPVSNTTNKITRIIMQSAYILNRFVFVEQDTPECKQFLDNVYSFSKEGNNKHDDAPDCLAGLSMFVQGMFVDMR
jgi:predicted phage terminase large subunit-like protein